MLATFRRPQRQGPLWQIDIDINTPIAREWVVLCDSPTFSSCLAAVELPDDRGERRFEAVWTMDPIVVRNVARVAVQIARTRQPALDEAQTAGLQAPANTAYDVQRATTALTNRIVAYMDRSR